MKKLIVSVPVLDWKPIGKAFRADPSVDVALVVEIVAPKTVKYAVGMGGEVVAKMEVKSEVSTAEAIETAKYLATCAWLVKAGLILETENDAPVQTERCSKSIRTRLDRGDFIRASGDVECADCGCLYREHEEVKGFPTLAILCNGKLVKL